MPGRTSRNKGLRGEREFAELVGGRRVPLSGAQRGFENDVLIPTPAGEFRAEVKRRKDGFATLYGWLEDEREKPDIVAFRADRKPWLVCMSLDAFLKLIGREIREIPHVETNTKVFRKTMDFKNNSVRTASLEETMES